MQTKNNVQIYTADELTNEEYRAMPYVSASTLVQIWKDCPAAWRFGEPPSSQALADGISAHAMILEPETFDERFYRDIAPEDYPAALSTATQMQSRLKELGIKGASGKTKAQLVEMVREADPDAQILDVLIANHAQANEGKQVVKASTFDMIAQMRRVLFADPHYRQALTGSKNEVSLADPETGTKCRFDALTLDGGIWDYKTTASAHPDDFARQAHNNGYWLKMAYQADLYEKAFGEPPREVVLLAQSKKPPYIPQAYQLTADQLEVGREQYSEALKLYRRCVERDSWPAYGGGVQMLPTPGWLARQYGFEDVVEIEEVQDAD